MSTTVRAITATTLTIGCLGLGALGFLMLRSDLRAGVYRERLEEAAQRYDELRESYNSAIRRTAVTELIVKDNALSVRVSDASGASRTIDTPFDPRREIYVDYIVHDGRLLIRRVFDDNTAPTNGVAIDKALTDLNWLPDSPTKVGKAVYRALDEGRWVVTVTGSGSLGLERLPDAVDDPILASAPEIREFDEIVKQADSDASKITVADVIDQLFGS